MKLSDKIVRLRKSNGMSQEELADKLGVSRQAISRWEMGTAMPDATNILQLSRLFQVTTDYLLNDEYQSDNDLPKVKEVKTDGVHQIMIFLLTLEVMVLIIQFMSVVILQNIFFGVLSFIPFIAMVGGFEYAYQKKANEQNERTIQFRKRFYKVSAWLGTYFPIRLLAMALVHFYPRPINSLLYNRDLKFEVHRESPKNPYVLADVARIREVLVNLLGNAVKFTKDGGKITLDISSYPGADEKHIIARYVVRDNGIGMSEEFQKKLFAPFSQEDDSNARTQYKGTGLGMAITKKYVDMMGGSIAVESKKGVGSTFTVEIPLELTEQVIQSEQKQHLHRDLTGVHVLMAEDNDLNAELATIILEDAGMTVTRASDGKEVVNLFKNHPRGTYDFILMDIMMPNMDGHQAAKAIRALGIERSDAVTIPIIALSANAFIDDIQESLDSGMNDHISKPINMEELIDTITKYIKHD